MALAIVIGYVSVSSVRACGPFFSDNLLDAGDHAVLQAPVAFFRSELERAKLIPFQPDQNDGRVLVSPTDAGAAEMQDLTNALRGLKVDAVECERICAEHEAERAKLKEFADKKQSSGWYDTGGNWVQASDASRLVMPAVSVVPDLPGEFADYFAGAIAWADDKKETARAAWEHLLARPPAERRYKSVWAAYMLGRSWETNEDKHLPGDDAKALEYYDRARELARHGMSDSFGLSAASVGWEARIHLRRGEYGQAIESYLEQAAHGDDSAISSLRFTVARALGVNGASPEQLVDLAGNPHCRAVITMHLISHSPSESYDSPEETQRYFAGVKRWLEAVDAAAVENVDEAEQLALAAYQANEMGLAQEWVDRAGGRPVARWVQAKLLLRAGKIAPAVSLLAGLGREFPQQALGTNAPRQFAETLYVNVNEGYFEPIPMGRQVLGELGIIHLARREYVSALDALLRSGYWRDSAYVAERVLTCDELKAYVDSNWPAQADGTNEDDTGLDNSVWVGPVRPGQQIRYLLARRLTRELRGEEARSYYLPQLTGNFDNLLAGLNDGWNEQLPSEQRAKALFSAAQVARTNGLELLGTELWPDWAINSGEYDTGFDWDSRLTNASRAKINLASADEVSRSVANHPDPDTRFHYRFQAAFLGWEAAKLMPDNSDDTARVLCISGSWIKIREPETADMFYKALVRRCRDTAIGAQADAMHWFPILDEAGNPLPWQRRTPAGDDTEPAANESVNLGEEATQQSFDGDEYAIEPGDSLFSISKMTGASILELLAANPGLDGSQLKIGQKIVIPVHQENVVPPVPTDDAMGSSP